MVYPGCARSLNTAKFTIERHAVGTRTRSVNPVMYSGYDVMFNYRSHLRSSHTLAYAQLAYYRDTKCGRSHEARVTLDDYAEKILYYRYRYRTLDR